MKEQSTQFGVKFFLKQLGGVRNKRGDWAVQLKEQSTQFGVKFFLKQLGGVRNKRGRNAATIDGETWTEVPNWE